MRKHIFMTLLLFLLCAAGSYTLAATRQPGGQAGMKVALDRLNLAYTDLQKVTPKDKGNHCVKAMQLTTEAIQEVQKAMAYGNDN